MSRLIRRCAAAAIGIVVAGLTAATPAAAVDPEPIILDPGLGCAFGLRIDITGGHFAVRTDTARHKISAGKGTMLTFTNLATGKTLALSSNGSVERDTFNADRAITTVDALGYNVIILFPTDFPAGPSTTLYVGRVVYTVNAAGVFRIQTHSGPTTDICAALS
jgi:hypothetical protein